MARHQLFFVGFHGDPLLVVVFQRQTDGRTTELEAKAFLAWDGAWRPPFWERVEVDAWPGDDLQTAVDAWQRVRTGQALRLEWDDEGEWLRVLLRSPSTSVEVEVPTLRDAGAGLDPHGPVSWQSGRGVLRINEAERVGMVVVEHLAGEVEPRPWFGAYEMWVLSPEQGTLVLGRRHLSRDGPGESLRVGWHGAVSAGGPFGVQVVADRPDESTGFALPDRWEIAPDGPVLSRVAGQTTRGRAPDDGPAVYDISLAAEPDGTARALVFHLQDRGRN
jgi:hypothetical protein